MINNEWSDKKTGFYVPFSVLMTSVFFCFEEISESSECLIKRCVTLENVQF